MRPMPRLAAFAIALAISVPAIAACPSDEAITLAKKACDGGEPAAQGIIEVAALPQAILRL